MWKWLESNFDTCVRVCMRVCMIYIAQTSCPWHQQPVNWKAQVWCPCSGNFGLVCFLEQETIFTLLQSICPAVKWVPGINYGSKCQTVVHVPKIGEIQVALTPLPGVCTGSQGGLTSTGLNACLFQGTSLFHWVGVTIAVDFTWCVCVCLCDFKSVHSISMAQFYLFSCSSHPLYVTWFWEIALKWKLWWTNSFKHSPNIVTCTITFTTW